MLFRSRARDAYGDDFFAESKMSFGEHIEDLRTHLMRALKWFALGMVLGFVFAASMLDYITRPVNDAISNFYEERRKTVGEGTDDPKHKLNELKPDLKLSIPAKEVFDWMKKVAPDVKVPETTDQTPALEVTATLQNPARLAYYQVPLHERMGHRNVLTALSATEAFVVWMMISLVLGVIIASPMILYELWSFVAAGLYPHEKRYVYYLLPMSIGLFFAGVLMCQFFVMPAALEALFGFNSWLEIDPDLRLKEWLSFAIMMPLITGVCFQTPLVMLFLGKVGIFSAADFLSKWRIAVFLLLIFAAVLSPSVDAVSLFILWVPMCGLYFLGILLVKIVEKQRAEQETPFESNVDEVPFDPDMMK